MDMPRGKLGGFEVGQRAGRAEVVRIPERARHLRSAFGYFAKGQPCPEPSPAEQFSESLRNCGIRNRFTRAGWDLRAAVGYDPANFHIHMPKNSCLRSDRPFGGRIGKVSRTEDNPTLPPATNSRAYQGTPVLDREDAPGPFLGKELTGGKTAVHSGDAARQQVRKGVRILGTDLDVVEQRASLRCQGINRS